MGFKNFFYVMIISVLPFFVHATLADKTHYFNHALHEYENGNYREAIRYLNLLSNQGNAAAEAFLGFMYHHGYGVAQDSEKAVDFYKMAAKQGNRYAQYNLAS